jgi:hypothetical protein
MDAHAHDHKDRGGHVATPASGSLRLLGRRRLLTTLSGLGAAGLVLVLVEPVQRLFGRADQRFPDWVATMPNGPQAYAVALAQPELLAPLPCFCGCMRFEQPHGGLKDCFIQSTSGELEPHAAFCEMCQEEALDAAAWATQGLTEHEIHERIVAKYGDA